ncbi:hypothetical protein BN7_5396 [Wickerhamomyces ciferrii]|uniref:Uncharacterized protein n=1 Tax=Wickerhamomyces ciferrii (strain ATCC 14091 / BCRC 22168 / CBS 111 / JCM 3599 / NBRC 0793 / NRRL Y-1031 F-60-10) TaxID=1206466 RepID=K0KKT8_WICCF|nr:uncharacterized protein BN7_5396 [Wickerhamomyces ciferrii]CCH45810.1 hypothetical protein BN7_5396 [Wickerhamomyces ciferrii]
MTYNKISASSANIREEICVLDPLFYADEFESSSVYLQDDTEDSLTNSFNSLKLKKSFKSLDERRAKLRNSDDHFTILQLPKYNSFTGKSLPPKPRSTLKNFTIHQDENKEIIKINEQSSKLIETFGIDFKLYLDTGFHLSPFTQIQFKRYQNEESNVNIPIEYRIDYSIDLSLIGRFVDENYDILDEFDDDFFEYGDVIYLDNSDEDDFENEDDSSDEEG